MPKNKLRSNNLPKKRLWLDSTQNTAHVLNG